MLLLTIRNELVLLNLKGVNTLAYRTKWQILKNRGILAPLKILAQKHTSLDKKFPFCKWGLKLRNTEDALAYLSML